MGYTKPKQKMSLLKRYCSVCECDLFLDQKETYVVKKRVSFLRLVIFNGRNKLLCITCNRDIKIKSLIK